jgi:hypothetical protein
VVAAWAGTAARHTSTSVKTNIRLKREFISRMGRDSFLWNLELGD